MILESAVEAVALLWPAAEVVLGVKKRAKGSHADVRDRGSLTVLWVVISASVIAGFVLRVVHAARMALPAQWTLTVSLVLLLTGLAIRATAIITLGRFFTANVAIHAGQHIVRTGLYRYLRHPSYSGMLLAFAGLGFLCRNWLSLAVIVLPITAALLYRIKVEEAALLGAFGDEYRTYRASTNRLVPGVY